MATPARQRTALGDIKNTPASILGKLPPSALKPPLPQSAKNKQKEREASSKLLGSAHKVSSGSVNPAVEEFPDIERMYPSEPESELCISLSLSLPLSVCLSLFLSPKTFISSEPPQFKAPRYFDGLVSSAFHSLHIQHIGDLPSLSDLGKLSLESTRPDDTPSTGESTHLGMFQLPNLSVCLSVCNRYRTDD